MVKRNKITKLDLLPHRFEINYSKFDTVQILGGVGLGEVLKSLPGVATPLLPVIFAKFLFSRSFGPILSTTSSKQYQDVLY